MIFKRRNRKQKENPIQDKVAKGIAGFFLKVQEKFADAMNKRLSKMSVKKVRVLLSLFCLCWGGLSIYFIGHAVLGSKEKVVNVDRVKVLRHVDVQDDFGADAEVDKEMYERIQGYKRYMASIKEPIRPGLLDSMNLLERIYLKQQNSTNENK